MAGKSGKKVQKALDALRKSETLNLKDLQKFVDALCDGSFLEVFDEEHFDCFIGKSFGENAAAILRYLRELMSSEADCARQCTAFCISNALMKDSSVRESFLAEGTVRALIDALNAVDLMDDMGEVAAVIALRVVALLGRDGDWMEHSEKEERDELVQALLRIARERRERNRILTLAVGRALGHFYMSGKVDIGEAWQGRPMECVLEASTSTKSSFHTEISDADVTFGEKIFESPMCQVLKGTYKGESVAVKRFSVMTSLGFSWDDFYKEVGLLTIAQHPNVVKMLGAHANNGTAKEPFLVTEFCARGNLHDAVMVQFAKDSNGFPYARLLAMMMDIAKGIAFLHSLGIIHRDVKTSNFLVADDYSVKMIDFGVSRIASGSAMMTIVGTPTFMAPEVLSGSSYEQSADTYSYGMVVYELISGSEPFDEVPPLMLAQQVLKGVRPKISGPALVYKDIINVMTTCWDADPRKRPTLKEIVLKIIQLKKKPPPKIHSSDAMLNTEVNGNLWEHDWYFGDMSKEAATKRLSGCPVGSFLVRNSSKKGCFAATLVFANGVRHILIHPEADRGGRYVVDAQKGQDYTFRSLPGVVRAYSNILQHPISRNQKSSPGASRLGGLPVAGGALPPTPESPNEWLGPEELIHHRKKKPFSFDTCSGNMEGDWRSSEELQNSSWIGNDCVYYRWSSAQARRCFANANVVFLGGAHTRQLFRCFAECPKLFSDLNAFEEQDLLLSKSKSSPHVCDNLSPDQHQDLNFTGLSSPRQKNSPTYHLHFYWNPLLSWKSAWCAIETCIRFDQEPPAEFQCKCPHRSRFSLQYTGKRIRTLFLPELIKAMPRIDYVVTSADVGDSGKDFLATLDLAPSAVVLFDANHPLHYELRQFSNFTGYLNFAEVIRARRTDVRNGHFTASLMDTIIHSTMTHMSKLLCPWERHYLH